MNELKIFLQRTIGAISGAIGGFFVFALGGLLGGIQWGASLGLIVGLIAVFTGKGFAGFLEAFLNSILLFGTLGAVISGLLGIFKGGVAGSTWGADSNRLQDSDINTSSEHSQSNMPIDTESQSIIKEGLTEKILFAFDPRNPLGRRRFIVYNILFFAVYFVILFAMAILLKPEDPSSMKDVPWFYYGVANVLIIPHWLLMARRALAAKIPVQAIYAYMSWLLIFAPICEATIGETLSLLLAIPSLVLTLGVLFKRNRIKLPYKV